MNIPTKFNRFQIGLGVVLLLAACGDAPVGDAVSSQPEVQEEREVGQVQQGIALTYRETTGNANMDMMLDMNDANLALRRLLRMTTADATSPLVLTRPNNYKLGIDDILFLAQKVMGQRSGLIGPSPLILGIPYSDPNPVSCGWSGVIGFDVFSYSADAVRLHNWPTYDGGCQNYYGDFIWIDPIESFGYNSSQYSEIQDWCMLPPGSTYPICIDFDVRNSEQELIETLSFIGSVLVSF